MKRLMVAIIVLGLTVPSIMGFYSVASAQTDYCTLGDRAALQAKGYNHIQEARICSGQGLQPGADYRTEGDKILDGLLGKPETKATTCQTQYGQCVNEGAAGETCFCTGRDGKQYYGFAR